MALFTVGIWTAKPGREEDFVAAWRELAGWMEQHAFSGRPSLRLFRDHDNPCRFVSFGPWEAVATLRTWQSTPGLGERYARMRELVDEFEPMALEDITEQPRSRRGSAA